MHLARYDTVADPIIIVGAGPVGLSLAWALVRDGRSIHLIESRASLVRDPRANTLQPPTLELLDEWEVLDELRPRGLRALTLSYWDWPTTTRLAEFDFSVLADDTPFPYRLHVPQWELSDVLLHRIASSELATVEMGWTAVRVHESDLHVEVELMKDNESKRIRGAYVVGADGVQSFVREAAGIGFDRVAPPVRFLSFEVSDRVLLPLSEVARGRPAHVNVILTEAGWAVLMTMRDSVRVLMPETWDPDETQPMLPDRAARNRLSEELGLDVDGDVQHRGAYTVRSRVAQTLHRGRVLLVGDAGHSTNPIGGTATNSGIQDAAALALALRADDDASLERWSRDRLLDLNGLVERSASSAYRLIAAHGAWAGAARNRYLEAVAADERTSRAHLMRLCMMEDRLKGDPAPEF